MRLPAQSQSSMVVARHAPAFAHGVGGAHSVGRASAAGTRECGMLAAMGTSVSVGGP